MEIHPLGVAHAGETTGGQTGMSMLIIAFRNFAVAPKNQSQYRQWNMHRISSSNVALLAAYGS
jgi:hypothetical protein